MFHGFVLDLKRSPFHNGKALSVRHHMTAAKSLMMFWQHIRSRQQCFDGTLPQYSVGCACSLLVDMLYYISEQIEIVKTAKEWTNFISFVLLFICCCSKTKVMLL